MQELNEIAAELVDRFGARPPEVDGMLSLAELRLLAHGWRIGSIHLEDGFAVLGYAQRSRIEQLARRSKGQLRIVDDRSAYLPLTKASLTDGTLLETLKSLLRAS